MSNKIKKLPHHGLGGSASPVLMETGLVNERWQFSTPYSIDSSTPLNRLPKYLSQVIMSVTPTAVPNLVHIHPWGVSGRMGEI